MSNGNKKNHIVEANVMNIPHMASEMIFEYVSQI